jgi:hypothetical protein
MHDGAPAQSLNRTALQATTHCLTGCAIGEILGLVIATALGWHDLPSILLAIVLAFGFGYGLTMQPLLRGGLSLRAALGLALAADTVSITVMEIMDNLLSLVVAFVVAFPVNRWLISRGLGHAVVHAQHGN